MLLTPHSLLPETRLSPKEKSSFWESSVRCSNCDIFTLVKPLLTPLQCLSLVEIIPGTQSYPVF